MGWKTFNVSGVTFKNHPGETMTRLDMISKYCSFASTFGLDREPHNLFDFNAIAVRQYFKSGASVRLGYVPKDLAKKLAPIMDKGWEPVVKFGRKFIDEETCKCKGLQLRYEEI